MAITKNPTLRHGLLMLVPLVILTQSACMHMMMGGHGSHDTNGTSIDHQVVEGDTEVRVHVPPIVVRQPVTISVDINDRASERAKERALVDYHWVRISTAGQEHQHGNPVTDETPMLAGRAREVSPGAYEIQLTSEAAGAYSLSLSVQVDPQTQPIEIDLVQHVASGPDTSMLGADMGSDGWIIGGIAMAAMMLAVIAVGGSMP